MTPDLSIQNPEGAYWLVTVGAHSDEGETISAAVRVQKGNVLLIDVERAALERAIYMLQRRLARIPAGTSH